MYKQIGEKIKGIAEGIFIVGVIASVAVAYVFWTGTKKILIGLLIVLVGIIASWLSTILLYGFGQLISTNEEIRDLLEKQNHIDREQPNT